VIAPLRIAMWSGPRNISTAMMRAFENRPDTDVVDEPFYAAYLAKSGADHPLRAECLAAQSQDAQAVARALEGRRVEDRALRYEKHMTHHMLEGFPALWRGEVRNAFLIRSPDRVVASYAAKRSAPALEDIGFRRQAEIFDDVCQCLGHAPPVVEAEDVLSDPRGMLTALCAALGIAFDGAMLSWPPGPRATDGAWAPAWYDSVWRSTGFTGPGSRPPVLPAELGAVAKAAWPHYERLAPYRLGPSTRLSDGGDMGGASSHPPPRA
jgi:hypothetical protein